MKLFRAYCGIISLAIIAAIGCGGSDVVTVDRTNSGTTQGRGQVSGAPTRGSSRQNTGSRQSTKRNTNGESPKNGSMVVGGTTPTYPSTMPPPENTPETGMPELPGDTPVATPPPEPSSYVVVLSDGGTLDIKELLETSRNEFEKRLAVIANGKLMLRTYYSDDAEPLPDESGPPSTATALPPSDSVVVDDQAIPDIPRPVFNPGRSPANPAAAGQTNEGTPFMFIGRIAATMRGPTAAFYRDGTPMIYTTYNRDSRRNGTLISWDERGRPIVIDQFARGRRSGLRVLFRARSDNDPTGRVALVQQWRGGKLSATHLVNEEGDALTVDPTEALSDEANDELTAAIAELDEFDKTLKENELELRKALTALYREQVRMVKAAKNAFRQQQQAAAVQTQLQILGQLRSSIQSPGDWRRDYGTR